MSAALGWALAVMAVAVGYAAYGWRGVVLAFSVVGFWLVLQFSRSLRALRAAGGNPVGQVANAVMLNARLHTGLRLVDVLKLTRSLGRKVSGSDSADEAYAWTDSGGDLVRVDLRKGRTIRWQLQRAAPAPLPAPAPAAPDAPRRGA